MWDDIWMVGLVEGYGGFGPPEEGRRGRSGRIDLAARDLLAAFGVVGHRSFEDHKASVRCWKVIVLLLGVLRSRGRFLPLLSFVGASGQELPHEAAVLEQVLYRKGVVWARPLE